MIDKLIPSAKIVDGILVITLPDAIRPVVWQLELGLSKSSAMEVRDLNDGTFILMLKTPRQDVQEIAPYATREQAVRALLTISAALEGAQGRLRIANSNNPTQLPAVIPGMNAVNGISAAAATDQGKKTMRIVAGIIVAVVLVFLFTRMSPPNPAIYDANTTHANTAAPRAPAGEPLSADDYLNAQ